MVDGREVISIILFGGEGRRFGWNKPKQFFSVKGKTILEYTVKAFEENQYVDKIILVSPKNFIDETRELVKGFSKVCKIIEGGSTRTESSLNGLLAVENRDCFVLIHDGVRPLVSQELIKKVIGLLPEKGAVIPGLRIFDTLVEVSEGKINGFLNREKVLRVQTPQGFRYEIIYSAYEKLRESGMFEFPDDSSVVKHFQVSDVWIVEGEFQNIKITTMEDIKLFEFYLGYSY